MRRGYLVLVGQIGWLFWNAWETVPRDESSVLRRVQASLRIGSVARRASFGPVDD